MEVLLLLLLLVMVTDSNRQRQQQQQRPLQPTAAVDVVVGSIAQTPIANGVRICIDHSVACTACLPVCLSVLVALTVLGHSQHRSVPIIIIMVVVVLVVVAHSAIAPLYQMARSSRRLIDTG